MKKQVMNAVSLVLLCVMLLASCKEKSDKGVCEEINFSETHSVSASELFDLSFVKLETRNDCLLGGVAQCIQTDAGFLLLDNMVSRAVYLFSPEGKFIQQIGKQGEGPGEYAHPFSMSIDADRQRLSVIDMASQKILFYHLSDFRFLGERKLPFLRTEMEPLSANGYAWFNSVRSEQSDAHLFTTDSAFNITHHYLPIEFSSGFALGANKKLSRYQGEVTFYTPYKPEVYRIKKDSVQCVYKFAFGDHRMAPIDYLEEHAANNQNYIPKLLDSPYVAFYNFYETTNALCVPYFWNKTMFLGFYHKGERKTYCFSQEHMQKDLKVGAFSAPIGVVDHNRFVSLLRPDLLLQMHEDGVLLDKQLEELLSRSTGDDNPILLLYAWQ